MRMDNIWYGGDWNPEQWAPPVWDEDLRHFREASINTLTINVFGWAFLQPSEDHYDFSLLDAVVERLVQGGFQIIMGTGTAAHPSWMARKHPDILRTDFQGRRRTWGDRHNACPSSPTYHHHARELALRVAARYGSLPQIKLWHVSNEYTGMCWCENCAKEFRLWLMERYGDLATLNKAWNSAFWSQVIFDWEDVQVPNTLNVQWGDRNTANQPLVLDYQRFFSQQQLKAYRLEAEAIRSQVPSALITTNFMGNYRAYDYRRWADDLDIISWDSYPPLDAPPHQNSFVHATMRGLKGKNFLLMEQTPSQTNWQPYNSLKRPGAMRLLSWQALAQGSNSVLFFQMRRSRGACEKFHGAVIEHSGRTDTRVFREVAALGKELASLPADFLESRHENRLALWFDWEAWWAVENSSGPNTHLNYADVVHEVYGALHRAGLGVDVVGPGSDLGPYTILFAPLLYLTDSETERTITSFVDRGGSLVSGVLSGVADPNDKVHLGGPPGPFTGLFGLWVEETDSLPPGRNNLIAIEAGPLAGKSYTGRLVFDLPRVEGAEILGHYTREFYAGTPALTRSRTGRGQAWYAASLMEANFWHDLGLALAESHGIAPLVTNPTEGLEYAVRKSPSTDYLIILNHLDHPAPISLPHGAWESLAGDGAPTEPLAGRGVRVLRRPKVGQAS